MTVVDKEKLQSFRAQTFRLVSGTTLQSRSQAVDFVNQRGFIFFWPISGILFPSLWTAVAGDRPVADAHDDPGHITWGWKDQLLGSREWYYGKVLRKKATMISFRLAPFFYSLSKNYGAYDEDYLTLYEQGRLTMEAKVIYEAILEKGPLDTIELRRISRLSSQSSETRFNRAIQDLQADFKILPIGVTRSGSWHYAFAYEIVARHYPNLVNDAHAIDGSIARRVLLKSYVCSVGAFNLKDAIKLFGWGIAETKKAIQTLIENQVLVNSSLSVGGREEQYTLPMLLED